MSDGPSGPEELTPREREILRLAREGLSNSEIAERLGLKHNALRFHLKHLHAKLMTDGERAALVGTGGPRWAWLPIAFTGWLAPTAAVAAIVVVSAGGYIAVRAANQSHGPDVRTPVAATTTAPVVQPIVAIGRLIGTPTTVGPLGGNAALFGSFPDSTIPPTMTVNIHSISPSHMGLVSQAETRTTSKYDPRGVCADVTVDRPTMNLAWFHMAVDDADVTQQLTFVMATDERSGHMCFAPPGGLATGTHFASVVVSDPGSDGPPSQRVVWEFHVAPPVGG